LDITWKLSYFSWGALNGGVRVRSLPALAIIFTLLICSGSKAQTGNGPPQVTDNILVAALASCDRIAEQAQAAASADRPFDPTHILSPILLLNDAAQRKKQQDELPARLALIEQNRLQCQENAKAAALQRLQEAQSQVNDAALGYRRITIEDFILDAADLAKQGRKLSLQGAYLISENQALLFVDQMAIIRATHYPGIGRNEPSVLLFTDKAARSFRQYLLRCQTNPVTAQTGCRVTITGTATTCKLTNPLGLERELPCVAVNDGRPL
jgi:hypothetical protein